MKPLCLQLPDELWKHSIRETIEIATRTDEAGFRGVWKGETSGTNGFVTLGLVANQTENVTLGTGIANVFSRSPALLAMSAATLDEISDGRAILGLGVSSEAIVEEWHGADFERPLRRTRETIEIVRQAFEDGTIDYDGELFDVGPYNAEFGGDGECVPIYNAAAGPKNRRLTGRFADGWIPVFTPFGRLGEYGDEIRAAAADAGRDPDEITVMPWVPTAVDDDTATAKTHAKRLLAREMAMGYNGLLRRYGYGEVADVAHEKWRAGRRMEAAAEITDEMVDEFVVYGTPAECRAKLVALYDAGVDVPVLWPPFSASGPEIERIVDDLGPKNW